jgi:glycosyltransferase involved in cell wall biosynthesis
VDGYLEATGDIASQARRVVALLSDERLHGQMSQAARHTATSRFSTDRIIPLYERYYEEVCARAC